MTLKMRKEKLMEIDEKRQELLVEQKKTKKKKKEKSRKITTKAKNIMSRTFYDFFPLQTSGSRPVLLEYLTKCVLEQNS